MLIETRKEKNTHEIEIFIMMSEMTSLEIKGGNKIEANGGITIDWNIRQY